MDFIEEIYQTLDLPLTSLDCGLKCAAHNPGGKPFCCDICQVVPAVYDLEWSYLQAFDDFWHVYRGDECPADPCDPEEVLCETPEHMLLLACLGPEQCRRNIRSVSCRQFPFFPYITSRGEFIGLTIEPAFRENCWIISHLEAVTAAYREAFVQVYDNLLSRWEHDKECYADYSEDLRIEYAQRRQRIPILHRNGHNYLLSPLSERLRIVPAGGFRRYGPYREEGEFLF
ncbi:MAG: hypothetical protein LLG42_12840 [Chloroflexi bacterium]|nr:hypothetical protein [Chloroflexota bacterium]